MAQFDPEIKNSWFFGEISRVDTNALLLNGCDNGGFLVRDSTSCRGQYVLSVNEESQIRHYIINQVAGNDGGSYLRIGEMEFPTLTKLISHYMQHPLDKTSLIKPAPPLKFKADYYYKARDPEDLTINIGDILQLLERNGDLWWNVRNEDGLEGLVPANYISELHSDELTIDVSTDISPAPTQPSFNEMPTNSINANRKLPALAKVIKNRIPCAYSKQDLKLEVDQIVKVISMNIDGQWEGICLGKQGYFPFTHVKFVEELSTLSNSTSTPATDHAA